VTRPIEYAQILLSCFGDAIADGPDPIAPPYICLRFGAQVTPMLGTTTDECCTGLAWVRVAGVDGIGNDVDNPLYNRCLNTGRRLVLELGTARCIPYGTVQAPPTCDAWTTAALQMDADHRSMEQAVCCFTDIVLAAPFAPDLITVLSYQPAGPDGTCISGTMTVQLDYYCSECTDG
jgi:hypothetical protein